MSQINPKLFASPHPETQIKALIKNQRKDLIERFYAGSPVFDLLHARAHLIDQILVVTWNHFLGDAAKDFTLVAVGGYGRRELQPYSDIDILVLHESEMLHVHSEALGKFFQVLWDFGLKLGQSVRTLAECTQEAQLDQVVMTTLIESRRLCGTDSLFQAMKENTGSEHIWSSKEFFEAKLAEQKTRYAKFHDTGFNLEPDVKEGPGGLRDIQMIAWVTKRHYNTSTLYELVARDYVTEDEYSELMAAQVFLSKVRFALQALTGRCENKLLFDHQQILAEQFGFKDTEKSSAVEQLMQQYYRTVLGMERLNEMLLQLAQEQIYQIHKDCEIVPINQRFQSLCDFVEVTDENVFKEHPTALLEVFLLDQQIVSLNGIRASTLRLIRQNLNLIDDNFRRNADATRLFMEILSQARGITRQLRRMNRYGVLAAYVPAFSHIVGRIQYDLFHVYTVDEHTLFLIRNLRRFALDNHNDELPFCNDIFVLIAKPELLYVAALFHDIAKGKGGDHSVLGETIAIEFCRQHQFPDHDTKLVAWIVRNHLIMSMTAQRKDIGDPDVIHDFATKVGTAERLNYLFLFTVADIRATNPNIWNDWKNSLLKELYASTHRTLHRGLESPIDRINTVQSTQKDAHAILLRMGLAEETIKTAWRNLDDDYFVRYSIDEAVWHTFALSSCNPEELPLVLLRPQSQRGSAEVFLYTHDEDYIFSHSTAILDQLGLTILDARIATTTDGLVLNSYLVLEQSGEPIRNLNREHQICNTLRDGLIKNSYKESIAVVRREERQVRYFPIQPNVSYNDDPRSQSTLLELIAADRPGLLSKVGQAFNQLKIRVHQAKITTIGNRAEDIFYITDQHNKQIASTELREQLRKLVLQAVGTKE